MAWHSRRPGSVEAFDGEGTVKLGGGGLSEKHLNEMITAGQKKRKKRER